MSYLPRRGYGTLENTNGWAEALGGILGTLGAFKGAQQQKTLQAQQQQRQATIDQQNAQMHALQIAGLKGNLTAQGLDQNGAPLPDPYTQQRTQQTQAAQAPPGLVDAATAMDGGPPASPNQPTLPGPDDPMAHIAALVAAHMTGPAAALRQQLQDQQAQTTLKIQRQAAGVDMQGNPIPDTYTGEPQGQTVQTGFGQPTPEGWHAPMALPATFEAEPNLRDQGVDMLRHAAFLDSKGQSGVASKLRETAAKYVSTQDAIDAQNRAQAAAIATALFHNTTATETARHNKAGEAETTAYHGQLGQQFATGQAGANARAAGHDAVLQNIASGRNDVTTRGQDLTTDRFNAGAQNKSATQLYSTWAKISTGPRGVKPPSEDPAFNAHLADFAKGNPQQRDLMLQSTQIPQATRDILRKLSVTSAATAPTIIPVDYGDE